MDGAISARDAAPPFRGAASQSWLRRFRGGAFEVALIVCLYLGGELSRGLAAGGRTTALDHAASVESLERRLHIFDEAAIQRAVHHVAGLPVFLGYAYLTVHLAVTAAVLAWVYRYRRRAYRRLLSALAVANSLAVAGYALFPTAPPRLAGVGIGDTVSDATSINLTSSFASRLYNPYAAVPSMHIAFSLLVGAAVWRLARRPLVRAAGLAYPVFVLFVIVATGNHFFFDAVAGAAVAGVAAITVTVVAARLPVPGSPVGVRYAAPPKA